MDLRQFASWCRTRSAALFAVCRADIPSFARELEAMGRARATVTRRLSTIAGLYKYAVEEEFPDRSPATHARRPRVDYESRAVAPDRNELGALLVTAGLGPPLDHALVSLLALNGLRVSAVAGADIEDLGDGTRAPDRDYRPRLDRHAAGRIVRRTARQARIGKNVTPAHAAARVHHRRAGCRGPAA